MSNLTNHNRSLSIGKGLCIVLMVIGHSPCPQWLSQWIYSFHMPFFFFASGMCFKEAYLDAPRQYFRKRVKGYYWPFVKWTLLFLLFHNLFAKCHLYSSAYALSDFPERVVRALALSGSEQLLGGYWFLIEGFFASLIMFALIWSANKVKTIKYYPPLHGNMLIVSVLSLIMLLSAYGVGENKVAFKLHSVTFLATMFVLQGYAYKLMNRKLPLWQAAVALCLTFITIQLFGDGLSMDIHGNAIFLFSPIAILTTISILAICERFVGLKIGEWLDFIGCNTLTVLTFHFLAFKLVSLFIIIRDSSPIERLAEFPAIGDGTRYDWLIYTLFGVGLPLIGILTVNKIKETLCFWPRLTFLTRRS